VAKYKHGDSDDEIYNVIANGVPQTGMQGWSKSFQPDEIKSLVAYIKTLRKPAAGSVGK
jgi:mono/diheme cytochrome c family protein